VCFSDADISDVQLTICKKNATAPESCSPYTSLPYVESMWNSITSSSQAVTSAMHKIPILSELIIYSLRISPGHLAILLDSPPISLVGAV